MPTYEYECESCQHQFEALQSMAGPRLKKCPQCGRLKLVRLIGAGNGIIFKGSGFYQTDYKQKPCSAESPLKSKKGPSECAASAVPAGCPGTCGCSTN